ncbi:transcription initiation protein Spt3 [Augochlora pura]
MTESTFSKSASETQFVRNEPVNYTTEIRQMMHGFGDSSEPLMESARIVEEVVLQQMRTIVRKAYEVSERRGIPKKGANVCAEDLIFLLRKDKVKLQRLIKYLELKEYKSSLNKALDNDMPEDSLNTKNYENSKIKGPFHSFLNQIDNTGELFEDASTVDKIKQQRNVRAELMTRSMDEARYLKFSKARNTSFANKNRHKFSDWLSAENDITISKQGYTILGYLAYETVAQIVDLALLVRQDQNKIYGDAIDRLRLSYVNPYTYKPYYHGKVAVTKPISPAEIIEALRRFWSPQLDMTGPFDRWPMKKPHLKLLAC